MGVNSAKFGVPVSPSSSKGGGGGLSIGLLSVYNTKSGIHIAYNVGGDTMLCSLFSLLRYCNSILISVY